jgi:hypothetical protein
VGLESYNQASFPNLKCDALLFLSLSLSNNPNNPNIGLE